MEPIRTTKTARLRRLKMYGEDLDEFVAFFQKNCVNVTISDNKNRYDSLDEMKATIGSKITALDIRGEKPGLHFLLNQTEVIPGNPSSQTVVFNELRTEEVSEDADVLFLKLKDFLQQFQRPTVRWQFLVLALFGIVGTILLLPKPFDRTAPIPWQALVCIIGTVLLTVTGLKVDNLLMLDKRIESPSFWVRNKDAFATHAVTATIGTFIGAIIGWFFGHYLK